MNNTSEIRILHVDDDPTFRDLTVDMLEQEDDRFVVETARSGTGGLELLSEKSFDCVLSDYDMTGMSGIEFLQAVQKRQPGCPFMLFTGKGSEEVASEAISAGVTDYIQKQGGSDQYTLLANRISNAVSAHSIERKATRQEHLMQQSELLAETGGWELDLETDTLHTTFGTRLLYGVANATEDQLTSQHDLVDQFHHADQGDVRSAIQEAVHTGNQVSGEWRLWTTEGDERIVQMIIEPVESGGSIDTLRGAINDVTELREREQALQAERSVTQDTLNALDDVFYIADMDGTLQRWNDQLCAVTGYDDSTVGSMHVTDFFVETDRELVAEMYDTALTTGNAFFEADILSSDGDQIPCEFTATTLVEDDGSVIGLVGIGRDLTERKQKNRTISRYERIIKNLPIGVFRATPGGEFVEFNEPFLSIVEAESPGQLKTTNARDLYVEPDDRAELIGRLEQRGSVRSERLQMETLSGRTKLVENSLTLAEEGEAKYLDGVIRDVTDRIQGRQRRKQSEVLFRHAQDMLFVVEYKNDEFRIERVNDAFEEATGLSTGEARGQTPQELFGETCGDAIERDYRACIDSGGPLVRDQRLPAEPFSRTGVDGDWTRWETTLAPVEIDGAVEFVVGAAREHTQQETHEEPRPRTDRTRRETLVDNLPNGGIFLFDESFRFAWVGGDGMPGVSLSSAEMADASPHELFPTETADRLVEQYRRTLDGKRTDVQMKYRDEWYRIRTLPIRNAQGRIAYGMLVTERIIDPDRR